MPNTIGPACPYCGQPIGRKEQEQILVHEDQRLAQERKKVEQEAQGHTKDLEKQLDEAKKALPRLLEERLSQEKARLQTESEGRIAVLQKQVADLNAGAEQMAETIRSEEATKAQAATQEELKYISDQLKLQNQQLERSQKTAEELRRQLDAAKTPGQKGGLAEDDLVRELKKRFPDDKVSRMGSGKAGADVVHVVMDAGLKCGVILYECKDTKNWQNGFTAKLLADKTQYGAAYALLVSTAFPAGQSGFCLVDGLPVVDPERVYSVAEIVREALVKVKRAAANQGSGEKFEDLLIYLNGPEFSNRVKGLSRSLESLDKLQIKEQKAHAKVWKEQSVLSHQAKKYAGEIEQELSKILS